MFVNYAELKLSKDKTGERKFFRCYSLLVFLVFLIIAVSFPFYCEAFPAFSKTFLYIWYASLFLMVLYGAIIARNSILPKNIPLKIFLLDWGLGIVITLGVIARLKVDVFSFGCENFKDGIFQLIAASVALWFATEISYLTTIFVKKKISKFVER